ncbi:YcfL family protein [Gallibacterium anatis]|uniref:Lipoprotein n=1 Tax=Gallibacterium anatis TaxID=750 RepID=A0A1A7P899_9PAST|nr:DUF1425 domain-containing protein [Gallibacterium anatis]OBW96048.1 lipoprotein [Gallibacterium anatis]OBW97941.1 lipoprotein [Gallibacterium anatis]
MRTLFVMLIILLGLSACSSSVKSPLRSNQPVINIEAVLAPSLQVSANSSQLEVKNRADKLIKTAFLLTWYDKNGVTQRADWQQEEQWIGLTLAAQQQKTIQLQKPNKNSVNYRVYFKAD